MYGRRVDTGPHGKHRRPGIVSKVSILSNFSSSFYGYFSLLAKSQEGTAPALQRALGDWSASGDRGLELPRARSLIPGPITSV